MGETRYMKFVEICGVGRAEIPGCANGYIRLSGLVLASQSRNVDGIFPLSAYARSQSVIAHLNVGEVDRGKVTSVIETTYIKIF